MQLFYLSKQERNGMIGFLTILFAISLVFQSFRKEAVEPVCKKVEVYLNSSSRTQLQEVRGIGPVLSDRIIKYKLRLGGFHELKQINEVYGIDTSNYDLIVNQLKLDSVWHQFDVNQVVFKVLLGHPYFDYKLVKSIFNYKDHHGAYQSLHELKAIDFVDQDLYGKIAPYLKIYPNGK